MLLYAQCAPSAMCSSPTNTCGFPSDGAAGGEHGGQTTEALNLSSADETAARRAPNPAFLPHPSFELPSGNPSPHSAKPDLRNPKTKGEL